MRFVEEKGWEIFNGGLGGDEQRESILIQEQKGTQLLDYVLGSKDVKEKIRELKIWDKIDSDHHPMEIVIEGRDKWRRECRGGKCWKEVWDEEDRERFKQKLEGMMTEGGEVEEEWKKMEVG